MVITLFLCSTGVSETASAGFGDRPRDRDLLDALGIFPPLPQTAEEKGNDPSIPQSERHDAHSEAVPVRWNWLRERHVRRRFEPVSVCLCFTFPALIV